MANVAHGAKVRLTLAARDGAVGRAAVAALTAGAVDVAAAGTTVVERPA